jgi:type VI secretion system (T6SS) baseplate-like injector VgrG
VPYFGVYRGTITDVSDLASSRVRISVPTVGVSSATAPVVYSCNAGWLMTVGQTAIVAFENGDTNRPIVLGVVD